MFVSSKKNKHLIIHMNDHAQTKWSRPVRNISAANHSSAVVCLLVAYMSFSRILQ